MQVRPIVQPRADTAFIRSVNQGLVVFRWLALTYLTIGVVVSEEHLIHPGAAAALVALGFVMTVVVTVLFRRAPDRLGNPLVIGAELAVGVTLLIGDGIVYEATRPQSLPWAWPAAALIATAVAFGSRAGIASALAMGVASFIGEGLNSVDAGWGVTASSKTALYVLAAWVAGFVAERLRRAEHEVSSARARDEVARTLHDGVLQTLAVVQRRSDDPELVALAREQDSELRGFLFGIRPADPGDSLAEALRGAATRVGRHHAVTTSAVVVDDLPDLGEATVRAIVGAVGEALTNAAKHAQPSRIVVFAEPDADGGVFCSVKDDGVGFDTAQDTAGQGIRGSIEGRIAEVGGSVEVASRPGSGTEVRIRVPAATTSRRRR